VTIATLASLFTTVASGLVPAFRVSRFDLVTSMRGGYEASSGGFRRLRTRQLRHAVLVLQSVFAVILLVGAGLLARSFARLLDVDAGYRPDHVLTARVRLPQSATSERMATLIEHVLTRLRAMPGVSAAGAGNMMPLLNVTAITTFSVPPTPGGPPMMARAVTYVVTPGYAEALGLRLRQGRFFTHADTRRDARKMLVNEEFVRQYMSGPVVGRHLGDLYTGEKGTTTEIVGVVGNLLKDGNDRQPQPEVYFLDRSSTLRIEGAVSIVVRTTGDPAILAPALRSMLREADRAAVAEQIAPLRDLVARSVDQPRFAMIVLVTFAALAVLLASVGLYGVLSYSVAQRRRELGIRAAIGADRSALMGLILREGLTITFLGGAIGLVVAAWLTQFMRSMLFGVLPVDTIAFAGAPLILFAVATLACLQPAIRAARTDPTLALRAE